MTDAGHGKNTVAERLQLVQHHASALLRAVLRTRRREIHHESARRSILLVIALLMVELCTEIVHHLGIGAFVADDGRAGLQPDARADEQMRHIWNSPADDSSNAQD